MADPTIHRRDFYWARAGWRWEIFTEEMGKHYSLGMKFWSEKTAALVANAIFGAYHEGRDVEREARAAGQRHNEGGG